MSLQFFLVVSHQMTSIRPVSLSTQGRTQDFRLGDFFGKIRQAIIVSEMSWFCDWVVGGYMPRVVSIPSEQF